MNEETHILPQICTAHHFVDCGNGIIFSFGHKRSDKTPPLEYLHNAVGKAAKKGKSCYLAHYLSQGATDPLPSVRKIIGCKRYNQPPRVTAYSLFKSVQNLILMFKKDQNPKLIFELVKSITGIKKQDSALNEFLNNYCTDEQLIEWLELVYVKKGLQALTRTADRCNKITAYRHLFMGAEGVAKAEDFLKFKTPAKAPDLDLKDCEAVENSDTSKEIRVLEHMKHRDVFTNTPRGNLIYFQSPYYIGIRFVIL